MNEPMRLFQKRGWWHVELHRNKSRSLRTQNEAEAKKIFRDMEKEWLRGRLLNLEGYKKITISELQNDYCSRSNVSKWTVKKDDLSFKLLIDTVGDIQVRTITKEKIRAFKSACITRGASHITVNGYLIA